MRADVAGRWSAGGSWFAVGEEQRSAGAARAVGKPQQPWEEVGGAGAPVHPFGLAAFGADGRSAVGEVELLDVEREDLGGARGGLIQHPPQRLLAQRDLAAGELAVDRSLGQVAGVVGVLGAALAVGRQRRRGPAFGALAPGQPGADRGAVAVPRRRGRVIPELVQRIGDLVRVDLRELASGVELGRSACRSRSRTRGGCWGSRTVARRGTRRPPLAA